MGKEKLIKIQDKEICVSTISVAQMLKVIQTNGTNITPVSLIEHSISPQDYAYINSIDFEPQHMSQINELVQTIMELNPSIFPPKTQAQNQTPNGAGNSGQQ